MALKAILESLDDVPEALHEHYTEKDGKFYLAAEGMETDEAITGLKNALEREKDERRKAKAAAEKLAADMEKFKDIDPDKYTAAMQRLQDIEDQKLIDEGKLDELLEQRTTRMRADHENQIKQLADSRTAVEKERDTLQMQLSEHLIDSSLTQAAIKAKVRETAVDDVIARGRRVFKVRDGKAVALERKGEEEVLMYGKTGDDPLSMDEWIGETLKAEAPHLFEGSSGGGAPGGGGSKGDGPKVFNPNDDNVIGKNLADFASGKARLAESA